MRKIIKLPIIGLFIFTVLAWSIAWPVTKVGLQYATPLWYTTIRILIGIIATTCLVISVKKFSLPTRRDIPLILTLGWLQVSAFLLFANLGLHYLPPGRSSLLSYTTPLWIMPLEVWFFGENASPSRWIGFLIAISGLTLLLSPWELDWANPDVLFGTTMLLLASLSWAVSMLCARYMSWQKSPLELLPWQLLAGFFPLLICALLFEPTTIIEWNATLISTLLYTGILVTGIAFWCSLIINKALPATVVSLGFLVVPVITLLLSAVLMNEPISALSATAMGLIIVGLGCVVL